MHKYWKVYVEDDNFQSSISSINTNFVLTVLILAKTHILFKSGKLEKVPSLIPWILLLCRNLSWKYCLVSFYGPSGLTEYYFTLLTSVQVWIMYWILLIQCILCHFWINIDISNHEGRQMFHFLVLVIGYCQEEVLI